MKLNPSIYAAGALALVLHGCASSRYSHFFPRARPLFAGLDEGAVPAAARPALARAKEDFQLARHDQNPCHARFVGTVPNTASKIFAGDGYRITLVHDATFFAHSDGPRIVLAASITGGEPYRYDEVDEVVD